jgi:hypothetical protein
MTFVTWQRDGPDGEYDEDDVGEDGREVDHLSGALDALEQAAEDQEPSGQQAEGQVPLDGADGADAVGLLQDAQLQVLLGS